MAHCPLHVSRFFRLAVSAGSHRGMVSFPEQARAHPFVWGILYILIGISLGRIWGKGLKVSQREWWIQLALNFCWSIAFFFLREPLWGMGIILILDVVVLDYIFITFKKDKLAAACFIPYILWLLWAT